MMGAWFMWMQVATCIFGCAGFVINKNYPMVWVWGCYSLANLGFVKAAGGF